MHHHKKYILSWCNYDIIAEYLSMRLLILQSMFSVGVVWPQLPSRFRITKCGLCTNIHSHCCNIKIAENCDESEYKRSGRLGENGNEDRESKCSHHPVKSTARSMYEREEQQLVKQRNTWPSWEMTISSPLVRCSKPRSLLRTLSTYTLPSHTWSTVPKAHATPTNTK